MKKVQKERLIQIKEEMKELNDKYDQERGHSKADDLLCEALEIYGEKDLIGLFYEVDKWYS